MKIGVLGTGVVGETIASALIRKGHDVMMGSRTTNNAKAQAWADAQGNSARIGSFNDTARFGELLFNCLRAEHVVPVFKAIDTTAVQGKICIDVSNPLDFSQGPTPQVLDEYKNISLAEKLQETLPSAHIVKALNTVNYKLMVDARKVADGSHNLFICGNSTHAKEQVKHFLANNFYWQPEGLLDLGDIKAAHAIEAIVPFWVLVYRSSGTPLFNFKIVQ